MEASELMHGDWIRRRWITKPSGTEVVKDFQVDQLRRLHTTDEVLYVYSKNGNMGRADQMEPIPLTKEILEKNGFEVQDQGGGRIDVWCGFGQDCEGDIEIEFNDSTPTHLKIDGVYNGEYYTSNNLKYVHQLQNALKLQKIEKEIEL